MRNSICFFATYFKSNTLPYYIRVYLAELKKYFGTVVLISTRHDLSEESLVFLDKNHIDILCENNEGYDFGLWYKASLIYNISKFDRVALVNDSCILFKPLNEFMEWSAKNNADLQGITFSEAVSKHIQSYFLIINKNAIEFVWAYLSKHKLLNSIHEVITIYEIGLSTELVAGGYKISAFMDNDGYNGEFSPYYQCINYHIESGIPLIKKKIIYSSYRKDEIFTLARMNFNISAKYYINKISSLRNLIIDFNKVLNEREEGMSAMQKAEYNVLRVLFRILRPVYRIFK